VYVFDSADKLNFSVTAFKHLFLKAKIKVEFKVIRLIAFKNNSSCDDHTHTHFNKRSSFAKQLLKRSIVTNSENITKYSFSPTGEKSCACGKAKKSPIFTQGR